ncbi:MAG: hypothetical protein J0M04_01295 [Verrucomicrobia bacterium]|nr:hypothetical protein [Verrucomicrobiota bacterium]
MKTIVFPLLAAFSVAGACEVPVFRFALERWPSEPLTLEIAADGPGGPDGEAALRHLRNQFPGEVPSNLTLRFTAPEIPGDPRVLMRLRSPNGSSPDTPPWWQGMMTETNARNLTHSPLRARIADEILDGASAVWVIVSQGNPESDARALELVNKGITRAMQTLKLPSGVIEPQDAARKLAMFPTATMDDVLRTTLPLRIRFQAEILKHDDENEVILRELLAKIAPNAPAGEALVAPVFGRGRVLPPAPASVVGEDGVFQGCAYLCGACACMVKQQNPGFDLPFRIDWNNRLKPHIVAVDRGPAGNPPEVVEYGTRPPSTPASDADRPKPPWRVPLVAGIAALIALLAFVLIRGKFR